MTELPRSLKDQAFSYAAKCWVASAVVCIILLSIYLFGFGREYAEEFWHFVNSPYPIIVAIVIIVYVVIVTAPILLFLMLFISLFIDKPISKGTKVLYFSLGGLVGFIVSFGIFGFYLMSVLIRDIPIYVYISYFIPLIGSIILFYPTGERGFRDAHPHAEGFLDNQIADEIKTTQLTIDKNILLEQKKGLEDEFLDSYFTDDLEDPHDEPKDTKKG